MEVSGVLYGGHMFWDYINPLLRVLRLNKHLLLIAPGEHRGRSLGVLLFYYRQPLSRSIDHK